MKKLLLALAVACLTQVAFAQKSDADMQKAVEKAVAASLDAKKSAKAATWVNLGKAYLTAYTNPTSGLAQGVDRATWDLMSKEKPSGEEAVTINGAPYTKLTYSHTDVYFNAGGQLEFAVVTKPSVEGDLLAEAAKAYVKAFELGAKEKDCRRDFVRLADVAHRNGILYLLPVRRIGERLDIAYGLDAAGSDIIDVDAIRGQLDREGQHKVADTGFRSRIDSHRRVRTVLLHTSQIGRAHV